MALSPSGNPISVPEKLTALTAGYKTKVVLAILAIVLFVALYISMILTLGWVLAQAIIYPISEVNKFTVIVKIGAIAGAGMLFVFAVKFVFKIKSIKTENRIRLKKEQNPKLWDFVNQICDATKAPKPRAIFVDPDVNAYVSYSNFWLSLIFPVRKDLTIGMGLTETLNMLEFKAVMSHEFGHFAQRSMKVGSYVHSANTIIHDMIFTRDKWDDTLETWKSIDFRLSITAWIITPVIWGIRQILALFYQLLNKMHASLSQEMEFNADKYAVSTSGSEAIISALWKLDHGADNWNSTLGNAYLAAQKNLFVENLYWHNEQFFFRGKKDQVTQLDIPVILTTPFRFILTSQKQFSKRAIFKAIVVFKISNLFLCFQQ